MKRDNQDMRGDELKGNFNRYELQQIDQSNTKMYKIERILRKRTRFGKEQVLVKWLGRPSKFKSWIPKSSIKDIK